MTFSRRGFLAGAASAAASLGFVESLLAVKKMAPKLRLGICDWSIGARGDVKSMELAAELGLEGVQISPKAPAATLSYATAEAQQAYKAASKKTGMGIASVGLTVTNGCPLATDERGVAWLNQTIDAAAALGCTATLIAFFGKGSLQGPGKKLKQADVDAVVAKLKAVAGRAKAKGVMLGLENTLSAKDNLAIIERVGSDAVQVYYDIANSTAGGYDVPAEIRMLKGRICEIHLKESKGLLGKGQVKVEPIAEAVAASGYSGWLILERAQGRKWAEKKAYLMANAAYARKVFRLRGSG
jgi:L-ribulose-5-phosphate 3-epimerase